MNITPSFSARLNAFRWIAAFMVVVAHIRDLLFVDYATVEHKSVLLQPFYFITGFSHEAVMVFFVISGFLVGGLSSQKFLQGRFDAADFAIHRFSRIYIVLLPALLAGYLLDHVGMAFFDQTQIYSHSMIHQYKVNFADDMKWTNIFGCLFMLQGIVVQGLGTNGPLWSLAYEWWYYTMFFLAIGALSPSLGNGRRFFCGIAVVALAATLPAKLMLWFLVWLVGLSIPLIASRIPRIPAAAGWTVFLVTLLVCRIDHIYVKTPSMAHDLVRDLILAAACAVLFCALGHRSDSRERGSRFHEQMAGFSYTTYLVHFPCVIFAIAFFHDLFGLPLHTQPSTERFLHYFAVLAVVYLYSYVFSLLTERHTNALRRRLSSLTGRDFAYGS